MHYYQFNIGDYRRDTAHLSRLEHGIYRDLIDWYYLEESPIPLETQSVMRRLRLATQEEAKALENVLNDFFQRTDAYHHARIDADISAYHAMIEKNRINGKQGGRPKKTHSVILANPNESQKNPNQEPITNNQYKNTSSPDKPDDGFAEFWKAYPRKVGKGAALKAWGKIKYKAETLQAILKAIEWQIKTDQWTKDGGQFIPHPSTWLNEQRWFDEQPQAEPPKPVMTQAEYETKREAQLKAAREAYMRQEAEETVQLEGRV